MPGASAGAGWGRPVARLSSDAGGLPDLHNPGHVGLTGTWQRLCMLLMHNSGHVVLEGT